MRYFLTVGRVIFRAILSTLMFLMPFISGAVLLFRSEWRVVLLGIIIIILTPSLYLLVTFADSYFKKNFSRTKHYLLYIYYFSAASISIIISWIFIQSKNPTDFITSLWALSVCFVPYMYIQQKEEALSGRSNIITRWVTIYSFFGYIIFQYLPTDLTLLLMIPIIAYPPYSASREAGMV